MKTNTVHINSKSETLMNFISDLYAKKAEKKAEMKDRVRKSLKSEL